VIGAHEVLLYPDRAAPTGASVDLSCLVDEVTITHGRGDATSQPEPASATVDITIGPGAPLPPEADVGAWLVVTTVLEGERFTRFTGRLTDVGIGWDDAGENTPEAGIGQLVATSVLADYSRAVVGAAPFPQELDGARVARVFAAAGLALDPGTSDPGMVEIVARDIDAQAALEVAREAATSAGGLVWETRAGEVRYADAEHRRGADVVLDLDACDLYVTPTWMRNVSGLINEMAVVYGTPPEGGGPAPTYYAIHTESIARYGRYAYSTSTVLATWEDAYEMANLTLVRNSTPVWQLNALPVAVVDLDAEQTRTLLGLEVHDLLRVSGMPATGATPTAFACWVEGWTEHLAWGVHDLELTVTDYCRSSPPPRWDDTDPAQTWDTTPPADTWDSVACTGGPVADLGRWDDVAATTRWDMVNPATAWDDTTAGVPT
jgi:hypothetical protein